MKIGDERTMKMIREFIERMEERYEKYPNLKSLFTLLALTDSLSIKEMLKKLGYRNV